MTTSVRYLDRKVLKNVLHHVDTHNRLIEEKEMWNQKRKIPDSSSSEDEHRRSGRRDHKFTGRMRSDSIGDNRAIFKQKLADGKWNHSGFMELYPDEFLDKQSMDEMSSSNDSSDDERRKRKKKRRKRKSEDSDDQSRTGGKAASRISGGVKKAARNGRHKAMKRDRQEEKEGRDGERLHWADGPTSPKKHKHSDKLQSSERKGSARNRSLAANNRRHLMEETRSKGKDRHGEADRLTSPGKRKHSERTKKPWNRNASEKDSRREDRKVRKLDDSRDEGRRQWTDGSSSPEKNRHRVDGPPGGGLSAGDDHHDSGIHGHRLGNSTSIDGHTEATDLGEERTSVKNANSQDVPGAAEDGLERNGKQNDRTDNLDLQTREKGEERSSDERFSDLEDEVFGLSQMRAQLERRERQMRRRLERKLGKHSKKRRRHHKHKKRKRESSVD